MAAAAQDQDLVPPPQLDHRHLADSATSVSDDTSSPSTPVHSDDEAFEFEIAQVERRTSHRRSPAPVQQEGMFAAHQTARDAEAPVQYPLSDQPVVRRGTGSSYSSFNSGGSHGGGGDDRMRDSGRPPASHSEAESSTGTYSSGSTVDSRGAHGSNGPSVGGASFYSSGHSRVVFPLPPSSPRGRMESVEIREHQYRQAGPLPPPSSFAPPLRRPPSLRNLQHPQVTSYLPPPTRLPPAYAVPLVPLPPTQLQYPNPNQHINPTPSHHHPPLPPSFPRPQHAPTPQPHYRTIPPRTLNLLPLPSQSLQHQHSPPFTNLRQSIATLPPTVPIPPIPALVTASAVVVPKLRTSSSIASFFKSSPSPAPSIQLSESSVSSTRGHLGSVLSSALRPSPSSSSSSGGGKCGTVRFASPPPGERTNTGDELGSKEVREEMEKRKGEAMEAMARSFSLLM